MKLYFSTGACSLAPHIVLREAGIQFELEKVDLATHITASNTDFYQINSKGQVPVLALDSGELLTEGPVICQYIADLSSSTLLPPAQTMARYRVIEWQNYITSELHKSFTPLFNGQLDANAKKILSDVLRKKYEWLNNQFAQLHYLCGKDFTIADAYLFTVTRWSQFVNLNLNDLQHLQAYLARITERPAVQSAMRAEGISA